MAISINSRSPIQSTTGTIYTNADNPTLELFLEDTSASITKYSIIRKEDGRYKVIFTGTSSGFNNGTNYQWRFDFEKFIRYNKLETTVTHDDSYFGYILGNNNCELTLALGDILVSSAAILELKTNGEIWIESGYTPADLTATKYSYTFIDRSDSTGYFKPSMIYPGTWYPVIVYSGTIFYSIYTSDGLVKNDGVFLETGYNYKIGFIKIPENVVRVEFNYNGTGLPTLYPTIGCIEPIYFMGNNGAFDVMYCSGVNNNKNVVERENIKIGKSIVVTKQETQKQIIQNTGLGISSAQLYNLLSSPLVYKVENNNLQEYELETSEFGGYNGVTFGNRNVELVLNLPYKQERITNKRITFFD